MSNAAFYQYAIEHDHNHRETISDHYPLTKQEIAELLQRAQEAYQCGDEKISFQTRASIQHRLGQGIVGMTCPMPAGSPAMKAEAKLGELFVQRRGRYTDLDLVDELYAIMQHQGI